MDSKVYINAMNAKKRKDNENYIRDISGDFIEDIMFSVSINSFSLRDEMMDDIEDIYSNCKFAVLREDSSEYQSSKGSIVLDSKLKNGSMYISIKPDNIISIRKVNISKNVDLYNFDVSLFNINLDTGKVASNYFSFEDENRNVKSRNYNRLCLNNSRNLDSNFISKLNYDVESIRNNISLKEEKLNRKVRNIG